MKKLQKIGGVSALIAAATYIFAMVLLSTTLAPIIDTKLSIGSYMKFLVDNESLIFIWHFAMYFVNGVALTILAIALYERLKEDAPQLIKIATGFGFIWITLIILSGLIVNYGNGILIDLYHKGSPNIDILKQVLETITNAIDSSDRLVGCLWIGLISLIALKNNKFPKFINIFGIIISIAGLIGTTIPTFVTIAYVFGAGAILFWIMVGCNMLFSKK